MNRHERRRAEAQRRAYEARLQKDEEKRKETAQNAAQKGERDMSHTEDEALQDLKDRNWFTSNPDRNYLARRTHIADCGEDGVPVERCWTILNRTSWGRACIIFETDLSKLGEKELSLEFANAESLLQSTTNSKQ